jgi:hypothetical protein
VCPCLYGRLATSRPHSPTRTSLFPSQAGSVNNLLSAVAERMEARLVRAGAGAAERARAAPTADDFLPPRPVRSGGVLDDLVGCSSVLAKLQEWRAIIEMAKRTSSEPLQSMELNFLFVGSPGACAAAQRCTPARPS